MVTNFFLQNNGISNKQANKQKNKQTNKQTNKQVKQTNKKAINNWKTNNKIRYLLTMLFSLQLDKSFRFKIL